MFNILKIIYNKIDIWFDKDINIPINDISFITTNNYTMLILNLIILALLMGLFSLF